MADTKITQLQPPQLGYPVVPATDVLPIVVIADPGMATSGSTRKVTVNQLLGAGGTATLASASITGDLTVDTSTLKVDSANNRVGIVNASPAQALDVVGAVLATNVYLRSDDSDVSWGAGAGSRPIIRGNQTNNTIKFYTASTDRATIDSSGNLGLGVTPSAWATLRGLQNGRANIIGYASNAEGAWFTSNAFYDGSWKYQVASQATSYQQLSGGHAWFNAASGTAGNAITFSQAMTLDASGNLLVGTTSGSQRLCIGSTADTSATANAVLLTTNKATFSIVCDGATNAAGTAFTYSWANGGQGSLAFKNASGEVARLDSSGNLILTSPSTPPTLATNGQLTVNATSNTNLRFSYRGSDGITRVANITLA